MRTPIKHIALLLVALTACDLEVGDLNNPGLDELEENPTPSAVSAAATGLLIYSRLDYAEANGYISMLGIVGRESYNFDAADPRYITEMLAADQLDPGSPRFGGNFWSVPYRNIRNANIVLNATDKVAGFEDAELEAIRGFTKTIQALDLLIVINTRHDNGAVIDTNRPLGAELAPIEDREVVLDYIGDLLDEAAAHLEAGGDVFPFPLSSGFEGFDTPDTFLLFNRALRARVAVYAGDYQLALGALGESFISADPAMPNLDVGVYHVYSTGSGDRLNGLVDPNIFAHPDIVTDAEMKADGMIDDRVAAKIFTKDEPRTVQGLTSDLGFAAYQSPSAPAPIIRNEELILLRAEANIGLDNLTEAADDLNFIRVHSGGLEPRADLDASNIEDELLHQRRYSLLFEGGHRWIDMRRFGRLDELPIDVEGHTVHEQFPIPVEETDARK